MKKIYAIIFIMFLNPFSVIAENVNTTHVDTKGGPSLTSRQCIYETWTGFRFSIIKDKGFCPSDVYYDTSTNGVLLSRSLNNNDITLLDENPLNVGVSSEDLFISPKPITLPASTTQFGEQLLMQAMSQQQRSVSKEKEEQLQIATVSEQINGMRTAPEWMNASLAERKNLYEVWLKDKYLPLIMGVEDTKLRSALFFLPEKILKPDIINLEILCKTEGKKIKGC